MIGHDDERAVRARILERARELQRQGFAVQVEPDAKHIPSFLKPFTVDLVAERDGEGVVLDVKAGDELRRPPYLDELARAIEQQPGWRLELEVVRPSWATRPLQGAASSVPLTHIRIALDTIADLRGRDAHAALVAVWAPIEVLLERAAVVFKVPFTDQSAPYLMKALYSEGVLSRDDFEVLQQGWRIRNAVAHGVAEKERVLSDAMVERLAAFATMLLEELEARGAE